MNHRTLLPSVPLLLLVVAATATGETAEPIELSPKLEGSVAVEAAEGAWVTDSSRFNGKLLRIGNVNAKPAEHLRRGILKFDNVSLPAGQRLVAATLRVHLNDATGAALRRGVTVEHAADDNRLKPSTDLFLDARYSGGVPLVPPSAMPGNAYEADVTDAVRSDLDAADGVSAFRLVMDGDLDEPAGDDRFPNFMLGHSSGDDAPPPTLILVTEADGEADPR